MGEHKFRVISDDDLSAYRAKVYAHCLKMIKEMFQFWGDTQIIRKDYFEKEIDSFIKVFEDIEESKLKKEI